MKLYNTRPKPVNTAFGGTCGDQNAPDSGITQSTVLDASNLRVGGPQPVDATRSNVTFYWADPGVLRSLSYEVTLSNSTVLDSYVLFNVFGPTSPSVTVVLGSVAAFNGPYYSLRFGNPPGANPPYPVGISFSAPVTDPLGYPGQVVFLQIINTLGGSLTSTSGTVVQCGGHGGLDGSYPYPPGNPGSGGNSTNDSPGVDLPTVNYSEVSAQMSAQMYVMWMPKGLSGSIPVPLGFVSWDWVGDALSSGGLWALNQNSPLQNSVGQPNAGYSNQIFQPTSGHPQWNNSVPLNAGCPLPY